MKVVLGSLFPWKVGLQKAILMAIGELHAMCDLGKC